MALPIATVVMPTDGVALRFEAEPQEICQHYLSKIALSLQDRRKRRYFFILYVRSLRNFRNGNKRWRNSLHAIAWGCYPTSVSKGFLRACILGRGHTVPRFSFNQPIFGSGWVKIHNNL